MLRGRGGCYKHTFYGIKSYQCMEMTPSLACANKCVFCMFNCSELLCMLLHDFFFFADFCWFHALLCISSSHRLAASH